MASYFSSIRHVAPTLGSALVCIFLAVPTVHAQQPDGTSSEMLSDASIQTEIERPALVAESQLPAKRLTLDQALALSVQHNLKVEVARYEPQIAEQTAEGAWGAYDPVLAASTGFQLDQSPNFIGLNQVDANQMRTFDASASLSGLIPYIGATLGVEVDSNRVTTNNSFANLSPEYNSGVFLTASIPVLRGLIWNEPWTQVKVTKIGYSASLEDFRLAVMNISEETIQTYWQLVADHEQLAVANKSLETAHALLDQTETQYEVGVVSKVEVVEAEAGVADREFRLIEARNSFENSEDRLVDAVLGRELRPTMTFRLEPADDPNDYETREVDIERSIRLAYQNLPDLARDDRLIEQREVELKFAKNQRLPQFDIDGRYGFVNTSGEETFANCSDFQRPPGQTPDECINGLGYSGYRSSFDDMYTEDGFESYSVRGTFSIPIPNRAARRNVSRSKIELRRAKTTKSQTKQRAILAVRAATRGIIASQQGIEAAERRRLAAEEQLRAERIRLEHGESTPFEVLQRETDLVEAESQRIDALRKHRFADARLERVQGTILDTYRIRVDDVRDSAFSPNE
jgi:outer membrane protein TolC